MTIFVQVTVNITPIPVPSLSSSTSTSLVLVEPWTLFTSTMRRLDLHYSIISFLAQFNKLGPSNTSNKLDLEVT